MPGIDDETALRALAHPGRRQMLDLVWDTERSSSELARRCRMSRPATSQHLKVLREAGLVTVRTEGNRRLYRVHTKRLAELRTMLEQFWGSKLESLRAELLRADHRARTSPEKGGRR